jgi:hypothetical protein
MIKRFILSSTAVMALLLLVFASGINDQMPAPSGTEFWKYISETKPYTEWAYFPGHTGKNPGTGPHGAFIQIFVNPIALDAIENGAATMPEGAILVKENYGKDKTTLMAITTMYKSKGYDPSHNDWFWGRYGADGTEMASGKIASCSGCHAAKKDNDYVFTQKK